MCNSNSVVVAVEEKYSDNNGAYDVAVLWDGKSTSRKVYNGYTNESTPKVNATNEQIKAATKYIKENNLKGEMKIGQVWSVIRARGLKKGTQVKIVNRYDTYWQGRISGTKVDVLAPNGETLTYSENCMDEMIMNIAPYWGIE